MPCAPLAAFPQRGPPALPWGWRVGYCPCRPSHGGVQLHRIRHRRPLAPTPQNLGLALQAAAWVKAAGALARVRSRLVADGRAVVCVRGLTARCSLRSLDTGTPVNAAVGGLVNALHGLPPPRAGLPGTFLPPMGAAPCSNGRGTVPHPSPPGARERHRLRPCQTKVGICWGAWGPSPGEWPPLT